MGWFPQAPGSEVVHLPRWVIGRWCQYLADKDDQIIHQWQWVEDAGHPCRACQAMLRQHIDARVGLALEFGLESFVKLLPKNREPAPPR